MKLSKKIEEQIKVETLKLLAIGKPDWDIPHTLCAVSWMRKLIQAEGGNEKILIPVMYFHDTGYEELRKGYNYDDSIAAKPKHAEIGALNAKKFLPKLKYFAPKEIERIAYLISNHDKHNDITEPDRQLVFEADGLAQIDWYNCSPNFDKKNCQKFIDNYVKKERIPYLKTEFGKTIFKKLLRDTEKYLIQM
jgi:hypothetical protein